MLVFTRRAARVQCGPACKAHRTFGVLLRVRLIEATIVAYPLFLSKLLIRSGMARFLPSFQRWSDGGAANLRYYSDRALCAPLAAAREAACLTEIAGPDVIDLAAGSPGFDLVPSGSTKLPADRRGNPPAQGLQELREAVASRLARIANLAVNPTDEVIVTHGVSGALGLALESFVNPGDRVVLFDPTAPVHIHAVKQRRARIRWISTWMENGRTRFRLDHLARALRGARLLVLASPGNPAGGTLDSEDLEQIAWWAERRDVLVLEDEAFERYQYGGKRVNLATLPRAGRRTLTAGSVSKGHGLAAARVGWLCGHRHLLRPCIGTSLAQGAAVATLCQQIALTALQLDDESFTPMRAAFDSRRRYAYERLQALGLRPPWPAGAFFFWVPVGALGMNGQQFAALLMETRRVAVTPGHLFGPSGHDRVRLSYASEDGRLREGLCRLGEFVRGNQGRRAA